MRKILPLFLILLAAALTGCTLPGSKNVTPPSNNGNNQACTLEAKICPDGSAVGRSGPNCEFAACPETSTSGIANPASVNCESKGGKVEIVTASDGSQSGLCKFPDGTQCEEWALLRNECQPGVMPVSNKTYANVKYGFEFQYPNEWPQPTMRDGYLNGGYPYVKSNWTLSVGIIGQGPCEGDDCSQYEVTGFSYLKYSSALALLKKDEFISEIKEKKVNGWNVITFVESGMRADQSALIFGPTQTLKFVNVWGDEKGFDQIISSFKFTK